MGRMKKLGKTVLRILIALCGMGVLAAVAVLCVNAYMKAAVKDRIVTEEEAFEMGADCVLVLGAGVHENGRPSNMLEDRILEGIALYKGGASQALLMSGDHGRVGYDEVNVMKRYAMDHGVPSQDVFMDHAGFSTYESLYRARDVFQAKKVIIVTQKYHLYRALYVADKLGLDAYGVASDPRVYAGQRYRDARELLARAKDFLYCVIKPQPTYLGEAIPVSGDGDMTNDENTGK